MLWRLVPWRSTPRPPPGPCLRQGSRYASRPTDVRRYALSYQCYYLATHLLLLELYLPPGRFAPGTSLPNSTVSVAAGEHSHPGRSRPSPLLAVGRLLPLISRAGDRVPFSSAAVHSTPAYALLSRYAHPPPTCIVAGDGKGCPKGDRSSWTPQWLGRMAGVAQRVTGLRGRCGGGERWWGLRKG